MSLDNARQQDDDPYDTAAAVLTSYLSEMLGQPISGLTHQALAQLLVDRGVDEGLVETVESYVATTERVRFAPGSAEDTSGESVLDETAKLLADLDGYFA